MDQEGCVPVAESRDGANSADKGFARFSDNAATMVDLGRRRTAKRVRISAVRIGLTDIAYVTS